MAGAGVVGRRRCWGGRSRLCRCWHRRCRGGVGDDIAGAEVVEAGVVGADVAGAGIVGVEVAGSGVVGADVVECRGGRRRCRRGRGGRIRRCR